MRGTHSALRDKAMTLTGLQQTDFFHTLYIIHKQNVTLFKVAFMTALRQGLNEHRFCPSEINSTKLNIEF